MQPQGGTPLIFAIGHDLQARELNSTYDRKKRWNSGKTGG
jgi:hypothetical protein